MGFVAGVCEPRDCSTADREQFKRLVREREEVVRHTLDDLVDGPR